MVVSLENFYSNKKVLVTGHTGFKGSWLSMWLQYMGSEVIGYSLKPPTNPSLFDIADVGSNMVSIIGDIRDYQKLKNLFEEYRPEIVFHLAAQALVLESYNNPLETFETNIMGTVNVLEAVRSNGKVRSLVNVTSDKCYENNDGLKSYKEDDILGGIDPYSSSKASAELVIKSYWKSFFDKEKTLKESFICSVRAGNVIGGGDWAEYRLVPDCVRAIQENNKIHLRNPNSTRPWQHVIELIYGYLKLSVELKKNKSLHGESFNFGPDLQKEYSVLELVKAMSNNWEDVSWKKISLSKGKFYESSLLRLNCNKARKILKWKCILKFEETMELVANWYRNFYSSSRNTNHITNQQIENYQSLAVKRGLKWAKTN